ncbi:MAG TPA: hypothetical protein VF044_02270 [Actinomycetota bacterium]
MADREERDAPEERSTPDEVPGTPPRTTTTGDPSQDVRTDPDRGTTADRWLPGGDDLEGHREDLPSLGEDPAPERD